MEIATNKDQGQTIKQALVMTNDPNTPRATLGVRGNVWAPIVVVPRGAQLVGVVGENISTVVRLTSDKKEALKLTVVSVSEPDKVTVNLAELEKGRVYELRLENLRSQPGRYKGEVKISTNYPEKPDLVIPILGYIKQVIGLRPTTLSFGRLSKEMLRKLITRGRFMRRPLIVVLNAGKDLKIDNVETQKKLYKMVDIREMQPGRMFQLNIEANLQKLSEGENIDLLKIHTNQEGHKVVEVPVRFEITH